MYTFIQKIENENGRTNPILAISNKIERLKVSETYNFYGQTVGTNLTGDSLEFLSQKAVEIAQKISDEQEADYKFAVGEIINGYDNSDVFNDIYEAVKIDCNVNEDFAEYYETCNGFNYWNGHNWQTVIVWSENGEPDYKVIEEDSEKMNEAIENCEFIEETLGKEYYETEDFWIVRSAWQGDFESYQLFSKSDYDFEDLK